MDLWYYVAQLVETVLPYGTAALASCRRMHLWGMLQAATKQRRPIELEYLVGMCVSVVHNCVAGWTIGTSSIIMKTINVYNYK